MRVSTLLSCLRNCDSEMVVNLVFGRKIYNYIELVDKGDYVRLEGHTDRNDRTNKATQRTKQRYNQTFYTVNDLIAELSPYDGEVGVLIAGDGKVSGQINLYTDRDYLYMEPITTVKGASNMNIKYGKSKRIVADWASKGKRSKIFKSFELGDFFLFELGKDFIGVSINNSYPKGTAWTGARVIKCSDVRGLFTYLQETLTDNATWNQIERTIVNSGFDATIDTIGNFISDKEMRKPIGSTCGKKSVKASYDPDTAVGIFYESLDILNRFFKGTCVFKATVGSYNMPKCTSYYENDGVDFLRDLSSLIKDNSSQAIMEWIEQYESNPLYLAVINGTEDEYIQEHISGEDMNNIDPTVDLGFVDEWYDMFEHDCYLLGVEIADQICGYLSYFSDIVADADGSYDYEDDFYEVRLNYYGDNVTSSTKPKSSRRGVNASIKRSRSAKAVKASRSRAPRRRMNVMAGPGAGYTIEWELDSIRNVNSFDVTDVTKPDKWGTVTVTADCDVDIDVTIKSAWSYMYGFNHPIEGVSAKIHRVVFDYNISDNYGDLLNFEDYEDLTEDSEYIDEVMNAVYQINEMEAMNILENDAWETIKGDEFSYGGGWSHSTWDGTILEVDKYNFADIQVTNQMVIEYVDAAVLGDNLTIEYRIDDYIFRDDYFESEEEAREAAIAAIQSGEVDYDLTITKTEWHEILLNTMGEIDLDDPYDEEVDTIYYDDYAPKVIDEE